MPSRSINPDPGTPSTAGAGTPTPAVVLVNLGTPDAPELPAVRRYLREFLSDRRIVDLSPLIWRPILELNILQFHARLSTAKYASVWYDEEAPVWPELPAPPNDNGVRPRPPSPSLPDEPVPGPRAGASDADAATAAPLSGSSGSPLLTQTRRLAMALTAELGLPVVYAMRYGTPSLAAVLGWLQDRGYSSLHSSTSALASVENASVLSAQPALRYERLLILPLYPQYSTTTTATVIDALGNYLRQATNLPEVRWVRSWPTEPGYIEALAQRIEGHWAEHGRPDFAAGDKLLLSFHGIPVKLVEAGDPYPAECQATAALLRDRLQLTVDEAPLTFQSRFGKGEWLTPATIETVAELGRNGCRRLDVCCPGFAADCLETLEEIGLLNRDEFLHAGGQEFHRIDCLNDHPAAIAYLSQLIRQHLSGW